MFRFTASLLLILAAAVLTYGQATTSNCPKIEVIGPAGVTNPGNEVIFVARASVYEPTLTYTWFVSEGTIIDGQGTDVIRVKSSRGGVNVLAEVTVRGLPDGCKNTASEYAPIDEELPHCSLDEWGDLDPNEVRAKMDVFFADLSNNPDDLGLIILYVTDKESFYVANERLQLIVKHAKFRKFDLARIVFKMEHSELLQTTLYRVPPKAEMPCSECVEIRGRDLK